RAHTPDPHTIHNGTDLNHKREHVQHSSGLLTCRHMQRPHRCRQLLSTRQPLLNIRPQAKAFNHSRTFHPHIMTDPPKPEPDSSVFNTATSTNRKQWAGTEGFQAPRSTPKNTIR